MNDATHGDDLPHRTKNSHSQSISGESGEIHTASSTSQKRIANLNRDSSEDPLGAAIWLNAVELDEIGVCISNTESIEIFVEDGDLHIRSSEEVGN